MLSSWGSLCDNVGGASRISGPAADRRYLSIFSACGELNDPEQAMAWLLAATRADRLEVEPGVTDEEERDLKVKLMQADLSLKQKQAFWETPRNIALLLTAVAAIAGFLGFKLGQNQPPQTIIIQQQPASSPTNR